MKLGFIGTGNMAGAIMGGIIKKGIMAPSEIIGSDVSAAGRDRTRETYGICVTEDNVEVVRKAETVFLSVKPQFYPAVIEQIKGAVGESQLIVTIAPGKTLDWLKGQFGRELKIVRTMPNTPAMVGEGMTAACPNENVTGEELSHVLDILNSFGKTEVVAEHLMDAVVSVSGSSGIRLPDDRGDGRRRGGRWDAEGAGLHVCGTGGVWKRENGFGDREAPGRTQGHGVLARGNDDRGGTRAGGKRISKRDDRGDEGLRGSIKKIVSGICRE